MAMGLESESYLVERLIQDDCVYECDFTINISHFIWWVCFGILAKFIYENSL